MHVKFGQAGFGSLLVTALCQKESHTMVPEEADHQPYRSHTKHVCAVCGARFASSCNVHRQGKTCIFISKVNVLNAIHIKWHLKEKNICLPTF